MAKIPWDQRWYHNIPELLRKARAYYEENEKSLERVTAKKILDLRKWVGVDPELLVSQVAQMGITYVSAHMEPGPMVVFPEYDLNGDPTRAQTKPLYKLLGNSKYVTLGVKQSEFYGPVWLGNQDETLQAIIERRFVVVCEGPFDLLALRLASPEVPSLCSLTKKMSEAHVDYLRLLGVDVIYLMYDNETSEYGERAMKALVEEFKDVIAMKILLCPAGDPSECLKTKPMTRALRTILQDL